MNIGKRNGKSGMTLIEILIVVALLGVLAGVLVRSLGGSMDAGKKATAKLFCESTVKSAIEAYKVTHDNQLPKGDDAAIKNALKPYLGDNLKDPWGKDYKFVAESIADSAKTPAIVVYAGVSEGAGQSAAIFGKTSEAEARTEAKTQSEKDNNEVYGVHF